HGALPGVLRVERGVVRLGADRRRVEEDLRAEERHGARALGEPLVPADADADRAVPRLPGSEAGVARAEVELLLVAGAVGDVALPVDAEDATVRVDQGDAVVVGVPGLLEEGDRDHDAELRGEPRELRDRLVALEGARPLEEGVTLLAAEIRAL